MHILIAGATGQIGRALIRWFLPKEDQVSILTRNQVDDLPDSVQQHIWDGVHLGHWVDELNQVDVIINLAGRSVNCRYTQHNLQQMMDSRVLSTRAIGKAIQSTSKPPKLWIQMSTATLYAHRFDQANTEKEGIVGGSEEGVPDYWSYSVDIAQNWEKEITECNLPSTRKVILRSSMVMTPDRKGVFDVLYSLSRLGLGGSVGGGAQYISWIHELDFMKGIDHFIQHQECEGAYNLCAPYPLPQKDFMKSLRMAIGGWGGMVGVPATRWMTEIGAFFMRTDTELVLKSRRVIPQRLLDEGFLFEHAEWSTAVQDLVHQRRLN